MLIAAARVKEMAAQKRISTAALLPDIKGKVTAERELENHGGDAFKRSETFEAQFLVSWELDLWGNLRWARSASIAEYLQSIEAQRALRMTIVAEVAQAYYELVALDTELDIVKQTLKAREEGVRLARIRFAGGLTSETSYRQAQVELARTATLVPDLERKISLKENDIAYLAGEYPNKIARSRLLQEFNSPETLPVGLPSTLLERRPDIRQAEQKLIAANAKVGVAYTNMFPRLALTGGFGSESTSLSELLKSPYAVMEGALLTPIFGWPKALKGAVKVKEGEPTQSVADQEAIKALFPNTYGMPLIQFVEGEAVNMPAINVGVILSGGQAPGGHNVISGLFDGIKALNKDSKLYGFILGPGGLVDHNYMELTSDIIDEYRNTGGFDIIGSGRTKLEKVEQFDKGLEIIKELGIKALVIIGGDDSNTNACVLAEYYAAKNCGVQVIGCPKTIDGDLKNEMIETSFGFDTACKTYSEVIGNIQRDCNSARKYWHFIKLMGRSASHIALECALQVQPNVCIVSEEVEEKNMSLDDVVTYIAQVVANRAAQGNNFGTVLIPEGLIEFIPAMKRLIAELNDFLAANASEFALIKKSHQREYIISKLSKENSEIYASLPEGVARQLTLDRDPHGNVQVSLIETEKLLSDMVAVKLAQWKEEGKYVGKFAAQHHFFGYEGRCAAPSNFDADYCYSLGYTASMLIVNGKTGYMSSVRNTTAPAEEWIAGGVPITMMMNMERRHGEMKPVIQKALVKLDGAPFKAFAAQRERWAIETDYVYPGPIQYFGPTEVCDQATKTLQLEQGK